MDRRSLRRRGPALGRAFSRRHFRLNTERRRSCSIRTACVAPSALHCATDVGIYGGFFFRLFSVSDKSQLSDVGVGSSPASFSWRPSRCAPSAPIGPA